MRDSDGRISFRMIACTAGVYSLLFLFIEFLRGHREDYWVGWDASEAFGALVGVVGHWVILCCLLLVTRLIVLRFSKTLAGSPLTLTVVGFLWAACLWAPLLASWDGLRPSVVGIVVLLHAGAAVALAAVPRFCRFSLPGTCCWIMASTAAGCTAILSTACVLLLSPPLRQSWTVVAGFGWAALAGLLLGFLALVTRRRSFWIAVAATTLVVPLLAGILFTRMASISETAAPGPNLLFIVCDSMRADYCSPYGGQVPLPTMEKIAQTGTLFEKSYSLAPWTLPSMNALMSSTYPTSLSPDVDHNVWLEQLTRYVIPASHPMLAEKLAAQRMETGMFAGNRLLAQPAGVLRGFEHSHVYGSMRPERRSVFAQLPFFQDVLYRYTSGIVTEHPVDTSKVITRSALTFLRRYGSRRFYLWLHYMDPHSPYDPPEAYRTRKGPWPLFAPTDPYWGTPQLPKYQSRLDLPEDQKRYVQSLYEGEMGYVDDHVGRVLSYLEKHNLLENTYVCLTADHGEEFWDHGLFFHGQSVYNELIHVPLIIAGPGIAAGNRRAEVISAIDVMPTLAGLMGEPTPVEWRGQSWAEVLLEGGPAPSASAFAQGTCESAAEPMRAVVQDADKLVVRMESGNTELYDLTSDPGERHDLSETVPQKVIDLNHALTNWSTSFRSVFADGDAAGAVDSEILERMNAVGYLD